MNKRHYEHTLPNIRGSLSNTYVLPQGDKQQPVIIQCFHIRSFLSKTSAYMGRHFYFLVSFRPVCRGLRQGLAKENTGAKRG